jgi:ABC-type phosphate/phosphonate transport system substrate-binding protein
MITSFRMYNAVPRAAQAWRALFERVFSETGVDVRIIEHGWPDPIDALWREPELCCAFMCGWPFVRSGGTVQAIAAPVPSPARYEGLPRYCSEFLVREASGWRSLEQTFGQRFGWMADNSQSGFNAPRAYLARFSTPHRPALYAQVQGPLGTPARALEALRAGDVDVIALDSFFLDLCRYHEPAKLSGLRCVATTPWTPIPLLVAAPGLDEDIVVRLRRHLLSIDTQSSYGPLLADVLLSRFVAPDVMSYRALESMARSACEAGYEAIR